MAAPTLPIDEKTAITDRERSPSQIGSLNFLKAALRNLNEKFYNRVNF